MNRFAYSLTFSLLTSAVMLATMAYAQVQSEQLPPVQVQSGQNLKDTVAQIAAEEDLPIALIEDNPAFVQEHNSDQTIDFSAEETVVPAQNPGEESHPTPAEAPVASEVVPAPVAEEIVSEKVEATTQVVETAPQALMPAPAMTMAPAPAPALIPVQAPAPAPIEASAPVMAPVPQPTPAPVMQQPTQPQVQETPAPNVAPTPEPVEAPTPVAEAEDQVQAEAPTPPAPASASSYSLNEKAPIPSKLFGDSGFAPTVMDKRLSISPEHRAKMLMKKKYDEMDLNEDGVVSEQEFVTYKTNEANKIAQEIFAHVDIDKNGIISENEYELLMKKMIDSYIKSATKNNPQDAAAESPNIKN